MYQRQRGVTLIELILVIGIMAVMTLLSFYEKQTDLEQSRARQVGAYLYQYNNAVRSALAQGLITTTTTKVGADWLKNSTCGGTQAVGAEFLPCEFPTATIADPILFGRLSLSTSVVVTGAAPNKKLTATTMTSPFTLTSPSGVSDVRADLSGIASLSAAAALTSGFQTGPSGLSPYTATTDSSYKSDPVTAKITMVASNNASNDVWLRTDGGNSMHATLNFDSTDANNRMIMGASRVQNLMGQVLHLGSGSALTPVTTSNVVVDSDAEIMGSFRIRNALTVDGGALVGGDLRSNANIYAAGYVQAAANVLAENNVIAHGNVISSGSVDAGTNVTAGGAVSAGGNVNAGGALVGQIFYDSNNMGYYVDPHATSNINTMVAAGNITAGGNVTAGGAVLGQIFYDSNNTGYYVDPHATSNLNAMQANAVTSFGRMRAGEFLDLGGVANVGWGCAPSGLLGRDPSGKAISCVNGVWEALGGGAPTCMNINIPGYAAYDVTLYTCPAGYTKTGWDTTGENWRSSSTPGIIIGQNDYAVVFCCKF